MKNDEILTIHDLVAAVDDGSQVVEIEGKKIKLKPVTTLQCVRTVKRFPALVDLFEEKVDKSGNPVPFEMQPNLLTVAVNAGSEAVSAFVACALGSEADAEVEEVFASAPDSVVLPLFSHSVKITIGDGTLMDFFMRVKVALIEAKVISGPAGLESFAAASTSTAASQHS